MKVIEITPGGEESSSFYGCAKHVFILALFYMLLRQITNFDLDYFDNTNDSVLLAIMARYKTLFSTFEVLSDSLSSKTDEVCNKKSIVRSSGNACPDLCVLRYTQCATESNSQVFCALPTINNLIFLLKIKACQQMIHSVKQQYNQQLLVRNLLRLGGFTQSL